MKEIGGYFGLEQLVGHHYYKDLLPLNSGRNALYYILVAKKIKKVYLPFYLCDTVKEVCIKHGVNFEFYHITSNFIPIFDKTLKNDEFLYIVNFYGQISNKKIYELYKIHSRIIVDNSHAFFQKPLPQVDTIYTCRKFFGVPDGAYLSTNAFLIGKLETTISKDRMAHLLGRYEENASKNYSYFQEAEKSFDDEPIKYMSKITHNILGAVDYARTRFVRTNNFLFLHSNLKKHNQLQLIIPDGPFAYPFYIEKGRNIRQELAKRYKIYIPTLWPEIFNLSKNSLEYNFASNILPLPCDQRYGEREMQYIVDCINKYI